MNSRLLEVRQEFRVVDVPLRIEIAVANLYGMQEPVFGHGRIIPSRLQAAHLEDRLFRKRIGDTARGYNRVCDGQT